MEDFRDMPPPPIPDEPPPTADGDFEVGDFAGGNFAPNDFSGSDWGDADSARILNEGSDPNNSAAEPGVENATSRSPQNGAQPKETSTQENGAVGSRNGQRDQSGHAGSSFSQQKPRRDLGGRKLGDEGFGENAPAKSIPANIEAERAVLGSLLIDPDAIVKVANFLRAEDFYRQRHGALYTAMLALNERREPLDFVTLQDELERQEELTNVGGPAYIADLISTTPTAFYVDHYARIVERTAVLRRLIGAAGKIAEIAYDESQELDEVIDRAEQIIYGVSESRVQRELTPIRAIMADVVDRIDFLARNQDMLMGVPTGFHALDTMLGGFQKSDLIILAARPGMGKCVSADTRLPDPQTGELRTVEEMVRARQGDVLTLNKHYQLQPASASDFVDDGVKPVYRVKTALGRHIKVTLSHPFLTVDGWRPLAELAVGARVAVPRQMPIFGQEDAPEHEVKALAYLLADGCMTGKNPQFTNSNPRLREDFTCAALQFPGTKTRVQGSKETRTPTVYVSADAELVRQHREQFALTLRTILAERQQSMPMVARQMGLSTGAIGFWTRGKTAPAANRLSRLAAHLNVSEEILAPHGSASIQQNGKNTLTRWLETQDVWGKAAAEKDVPPSVYRYTKSKLALFLNRLFACDGSIYIQNQNQPAISYSTVSPALARSVQHLLLRFGILAKVRERSIRYQGNYRPALEVRVTDAESLRIFVDEIGTFGKEEAVAAVRARLSETAINTNRDTIPVGVWEKIIQAKGKQSWRQIGIQMGLGEGANLHVGKRAPSRQRLLDIVAAIRIPTNGKTEEPRSTELSDLAQSDVYWDEIVAIDYVGEQQVYDLTVPQTHNFVADDMLVHNTSLGLSVAQNAAKNFNARVAVFSLEMGNDQLVQRLLSMETGIDSHRLRLGQVYEDEWDKLIAAANLLASTNVFIDDTPAATVNEIRTKARRLYAEYGLDMIIIDYMQLMTGQGGGRNENRQQEISYISRSLKTLARELNVPVIALSQLSRAVESRADKRPMLSDLRESGCLTGDTLIHLPETGCRVPIRDLAGQHGFVVSSLNTKTWKLEHNRVSNAFCTGTRPVFTLTTQLGRSVRATANHKFLTIEGWKRLDKLEQGERIALPRTLDVEGSTTLSHDQLALIGHMIGDGCTLPRHAIQYTTREKDLAETVAALAKSVFGNAIEPRINPERQWFQVYLAATEHLTHRKRNPLAEWFDSLNIFGLRSYEKFVPTAMFSQSKESTAIFLRHLWATDGCIRMTWGKKPRPAIYYATSSEQLAYDVQLLLLRLGINARKKRMTQAEKGRDQYHIIVSGQPDWLKFMDSVGAVGEYKQKSLNNIRHWLHERAHNTNRDIIPHSIWRKHAVPAMQRNGITSRQMQAKLGNQYCGTGLYKQNVSRDRAARLADVVQCSEIAALSQSDVYWDSVVSIEENGMEPVYDLTVPGNQNFVANNVIVHNSIEQDADVVMFIYREDYYIEDTDRQNIADVIVSKHRHGSTGTASLYFRKELTQFSDLEIQRTELDY